MVYAYTQDVPIDEEIYRRIIDRIGPEPIAGQVLHLCVRKPGGGLRYIDVWESEQACATAFEERIHPAVDAVFGDKRPEQEPEVHHLDVLHADGPSFEPTWS
jgi:hypothetical protein